MFQICVIKENSFSDFEKSLWTEKQKVIDLITFKETNDLNVAIGEVFNPDFKDDKLNLNMPCWTIHLSKKPPIIGGFFNAI